MVLPVLRYVGTPESPALSQRSLGMESCATRSSPGADVNWKDPLLLSYYYYFVISSNCHYFLMAGRNGVYWNGKMGRRELGGVKGGKTIIRMYYMIKMYSIRGGIK